MAITTPRDLVRLEISDTTRPGADPLFWDDEIDAKLAANNNAVLATAADLYEILAGRCSAKVDFEWQGQSFKQRDGAKYFMDMADRTRARAIKAANGGTGIGTIQTFHRDGYNEHLRPAAGRVPRHECTDPDQYP